MFFMTDLYYTQADVIDKERGFNDTCKFSLMIELDIANEIYSPEITTNQLSGF